MADTAQPRSIPDRNALMQALIDTNDVPAQTPTPSPTPVQSGLGHLLARLLGLGG
jgi:hypothetical protein